MHLLRRTNIFRMNEGPIFAVAISWSIWWADESPYNPALVSLHLAHSRESGTFFYHYFSEKIRFFIGPYK